MVLWRGFGLVLVRSLWLISHMRRELVPSGRAPCCLSLVLRLFCFVFVVFAFTEAAALRSIVLRYACAPTAIRSYHCLHPFSPCFCSLEMSVFPSIFVPLPCSSLYGEYVVHFFLTDGGFLPYDYGLGFLHQLMREFDQSINQSRRRQMCEPDR